MSTVVSRISFLIEYLLLCEVHLSSHQLHQQLTNFPTTYGTLNEKEKFSPLSPDECSLFFCFKYGFVFFVVVYGDGGCAESLEAGDKDRVSINLY